MDSKIEINHSRNSYHEQDDQDDEANLDRSSNFKDLHNPIVKAIWNVDRFSPKKEEKLRELRNLLKKYNPNILCDILHDVTGQPIAKASPLLIACFEGDVDVIRLLIESGVDVNQTESEHHLTALHVIVDAEFAGQSLRQKDRAELVRLLVKHNANVNHLDRNNMAAIHKAVIHDRPECCQELMEAKADPNVIYMGDTPLSIAARHNRDKICKILLGYKETNVNHRNDQGGTPLHYACAALVDSSKCVEMLIKRGAKVNVQDHKKNTPAMVASFFDKPNILQYLVNECVDLTIRNNEDKDAYDIANEKEHHEARAILSRELERNGIFRKPCSTKQRIENELSKNFELKTRIK